MIIDNTIHVLKARHQEFELAVERESERPMPDSMALQFLKRQKLRIKDQIVRLSMA